MLLNLVTCYTSYSYIFLMSKNLQKIKILKNVENISVNGQCQNEFKFDHDKILTHFNWSFSYWF